VCSPAPPQYRARSLRRAALRAPSFKAKARLEKESEALLRRARDLDPTDGRPYVSLGRLLVQQRRVDEARALFDDGAAATGGANSHVWQAWATLEARAGNTAKARTLYDAATVADPAHAAAWHGWGLLEKRAGDRGRARDLWVRGVREAKKDAAAYAVAGPNPHLHQSLAMLAAEAGFMEEARAWFGEAVSGRAGSRAAPVWHAWAMAEARCPGGEPAAARYLFARGLEAAPRSRYVHLSWALWEAGAGEVANARRLLARGHALNRRDPAILQAWALLEARRGDADAARDLLARAAALEPRHLPVWQAWGLLEGRAGNLDRARELFKSGLAACPDTGDTAGAAHLWQAWGTVEAGAGDTATARALFRAALRADPACEPAWHAWAAMEEGAGEYARADELRALRLQARTETALPRGFRESLDPARAAGGGGGGVRGVGGGLGAAMRGEGPLWGGSGGAGVAG
jgi:Tfp pilus assembly protein PilF